MEEPMAGRGSLPAPERQALSRIRLLLTRPGLVHGFLRVNRRRCGKDRCHCCKGDLHTSLSLVVMEESRQTAVHVPRAWEDRVREWVERDRQIRGQLLDLSAMYVTRLRSRKE